MSIRRKVRPPSVVGHISVPKRNGRKTPRNDVSAGRRPDNRPLDTDGARAWFATYLPDDIPDETVEDLLSMWLAARDMVGGHGDGWPVNDLVSIYLTCRCYMLNSKSKAAEVGCGVGYSAAVMAGALALKDGTFTSYDDDNHFAGIARRNLQRLPWSDSAEVVLFKNRKNMRLDLDTPVALFFIDSDDDIRERTLIEALIGGMVTPETEIYMHDITRDRERGMCKRYYDAFGITYDVVVREEMGLARLYLPAKKISNRALADYLVGVK